MMREGTIVVTGAASGLGAACVDAVVAAGHHVLAVDVAPCAPQEGVEEFLLDLADGEAVTGWADALAAGGRSLAGMVLAAGIQVRESAAFDVEVWHRTIAVNLLANARLVAGALPLLIDGASVVALGSVGTSRLTIVTRVRR